MYVLPALPTLSQWRYLACIRFYEDLPKPLGSLYMAEAVPNGYNLRSGDFLLVERTRDRTDRLAAFCINEFSPLGVTLEGIFRITF